MKYQSQYNHFYKRKCFENDKGKMLAILFRLQSVNTLRPGQDGCQFPNDIFKYIFLNENIWISIGILLKFVLKGPINNIPALVQIMAWRLTGDKPLSEPMMISLLTHICITRPQCVKQSFPAKQIPTLMHLTLVFTGILYGWPWLSLSRSFLHFLNQVWPSNMMPYNYSTIDQPGHNEWKWIAIN